MAQQGPQMKQEIICCSKCWNLPNDPVTIPCGHSFCRNCIKSHWDKETIHSCPLCLQTFRPRPAPVRNTESADLVEEQNKTVLQAAPVCNVYPGPEDMACDLCTGRKRKALKSCLQCLVSYCEQHLQSHYDVVPLKKHKLVDPAKLQENICTRHNEVRKIFCHTDKQSICYVCSMAEHKGHRIVIAEEEMKKRQVEIEPRRQKIQQRIQDREKDVKMLQQEVEAINRSADKAVEDSEKMSKELVTLIETRSSDIKHKIKFQQEMEVKRAKKHQEMLQQALTDLRREDAELEQLSHMQDQTQFLQNYFSLSCPSESFISSELNARPLRYFKDVTKAMSEAKGKLLESCTKKWNMVSQTVTEVDVLLPQDPKTRAELSHYAVNKSQLKLDPNTANTQMVLSEENRKATSVNDEQEYPSHPDRFMYRSQVLSKKCLTGRCYWEVQWSGMGISVAVAYKNIGRTGEESVFGNNDKSWVLDCSTKGYIFKHNNDKKNIPSTTGPQSSKVGVFLDYRAGILSFYDISETVTLLHKIKTTFTHPLYAGLGVYFFGSTAEFCFQ